MAQRPTPDVKRGRNRRHTKVLRLNGSRNNHDGTRQLMPFVRGVRAGHGREAIRRQSVHRAREDWDAAVGGRELIGERELG